MIPRRISNVFLLFEAIIAIHFAYLAIKLIPFKYLVVYFGKKNIEIESRGDATIQKIALISSIIQRAAGFTLFKSKCYDQALAGRILLKRRGVKSTLYLGLRMHPEKLSAHAWLKSGNIFITGQKEMGDYAELINFTA